MNWPTFSLVTVLVAALLVLLWMRHRSRETEQQTLTTTLTSLLSSVTATLVQQAETQTTQQAKALGALVQTQQDSIRGLSSQTTALLSQLADATRLLATKDPIAYSQVASVDVAHEASGGGTPYPAADDSEWRRLEDADEIAARQETSKLAATGRQFLQDMGVNVDDLGFAGPIQ